MMIKAGSTSRMVTVYAFDATTGLPYVTAAFGDAGISLWYRRGTTGAVTAITPATQTVTGAYSSGGFILLNAADNAYRFDIPDAAFAAGVDEVEIGGHATAWKLIGPTVQLTGFDPRTDAVATVAGSLDTNVKQWAGTAVASPHTAGYPVVTVKDGTGTGEIDTSSGAVVSVTTTTNLTNAPSDSSGVTTLLSRLTSTRAGYLDNLSAGAVATAAKLLSYVQSMLRSDVTVDTDIGGTYDDATDSQQAIRDRGDAAWGASGVATQVWGNSDGVRTLTQGAASVVTAVTGSAVTVYRGTRWSVSLTGLTAFNVSTYQSIIVSVKRSSDDLDADAIFQVRKNRTGSPVDGLTYFENAPTITAGQASVTVDSGTAITIVCEGATAQYAEPGTYSYSVKLIDGSGYPSMISSGGTWVVVGEMPRLVS